MIQARIILLILIVVGSIVGFILSHHDWDYKKVNMPQLEGVRILMVVAPEGFNPVEYRAPRNLFERSGAHVTVASTQIAGLVSERWPFWSLRRMRINADILIEDVEVSDYDAVLFIGGGEQKLIDQPILHAIAKETVAADKVLGAICKAPLILARAGVLEGRRATVWHPFGIVDKYLNILAEAGSIALKKNIVVDGRIVTANRPTHASLFAEQIAQLLAI